MLAQDLELETEIEFTRLAGLFAKNAAEQRAAFQRMAELLKQRTPERVAQMEREKGLR